METKDEGFDEKAFREELKTFSLNNHSQDLSQADIIKHMGEWQFKKNQAAFKTNWDKNERSWYDLQCSMQASINKREEEIFNLKNEMRGQLEEKDKQIQILQIDLGRQDAEILSMAKELYQLRRNNTNLQSQLTKAKANLDYVNIQYRKVAEKLQETGLKLQTANIELEEARKVVGFYADINTWIKQTTCSEGNLVSWKPKHPDGDVSIIPYTIGTSNGNFHCKGRLAREFQSKFPAGI